MRIYHDARANATKSIETNNQKAEKLDMETETGCLRQECTKIRAKYAFRQLPFRGHWPASPDVLQAQVEQRNLTVLQGSECRGRLPRTRMRYWVENRDAGQNLSVDRR